MGVTVDVAYKSLNKFTEILCGDRVEILKTADSDIMILADLTEMEIEEFGRQLSWSTYDFNEEHETDIKPIAKSAAHFKKWQGVYPFYTNVQQEGVELYGTA